MFSILEETAMPKANGKVFHIKWKCKDDTLWRICTIHTWGFSSCAVFNLMNFTNSLGDAKNAAFSADEFYTFLGSLMPDWKPKEAYFLLSTQQLECTLLQKLVKHKEVKLRDRFTNKSHGPNEMFLYRWSAGKDFRRLSCKT